MLSSFTSQRRLLTTSLISSHSTVLGKTFPQIGGKHLLEFFLLMVL